MSNPLSNGKSKSEDDFLRQYGPWALVAGASQGLGEEYARQLAERGLNLALAARRPERLQDLAGRLSEEHGILTRSICLDLSKEGAHKAIAEQTAGLEIGLLVYNAAYSAIGPFLETPLEEHLKEIDTNCRAPLALAHLLGQRMLPRRRGGIILMSSLSSSQGSPLISNYAATKAYNMILAEGLWDELRAEGIDVLACCAGSTVTPNYLHSLESRGKTGPGGAMAPEAVVRETLAALGKQPSLVPGRSNRMAAFVMRRLLPRPTAVRIMGRVLRGMYQG